MPIQVSRAQAVSMAKGKKPIPECDPVFVAKLPSGGHAFYRTFAEAQAAEVNDPENSSVPDEDPFKP